MKKYGVAVIGAGARGKKYIQALRQMGRFDMVAVCEILPDRLDYAKNELGFQISTDEYKDAVLCDGVDIVVICAPAYLHSEIGIFAMQNGKHVVSEKPMDLSLKRAEELIKASEEYDRKLALGLQYHNMAHYRKIRKAACRNLVGTPRMIRFDDIRSIRPKIKMHDAETGNGGPIVDMACHFVDLTRWFFDSDPVRVSARVNTFAVDRPEIAHFVHKAPDTGILTIEFDSGDTAIIHICWGLPPTVTSTGNAFKLIGPEGLVEVVEGKVICAREEERIEILLNGEEQEETTDSEVTLLKKFVEAIEGTGTVQRGGRDGFIALATSLAAIKSSALGRPVKLDEIYTEKPDVIACMNATE